MKRAAMAAVAAGALALACSIPGHAAPGWVVASEHVLAPPAPVGAPAVVLLDQTELAIDARLGVRRHQRRVFRILQPKGVDLASFGFQLEPGARLQRLQAWTVASDRDDWTDGSDVAETTLQRESYGDTRLVMVRAPRPRPGDVVAVELVATEQLPFPFYAWYPQEGGLAVAHAELAIELPEGWDLALRSTGAGNPVMTNEARRRRLSVGPLAATPEEFSAPSEGLVAPHVLVRLVGAAGQSFADWKAIAAWYARLSATALAPPATATELVARARDRRPLEGLDILTRDVQHEVSYAAIELGMQRWEPDAPVNTWQRRYGDCKDKSVLLASALKAVGIEARPVLTCTRDVRSVDPQWADPTQFNHCIVALAWPDSVTAPAAATVRGPSGKRWTLFDPTDPSTPLGLLPAAIGDAWGLIADPEEGLIRIPAMGEGRIGFDIRARLGDDGVLVGTVRVSAERAGMGMLDMMFAQADEAQRNERLAALLAHGGTHPEVEAVRWLGVDSLRFAASLEADFRVDDVSRRAGPAMLVTPFVPLGRREPPPRDSTRALPVWLGWPLAVEEHLELRLPTGMHAAEMPSSLSSAPAGEYRMSAHEKDGVLVVDRRLELREAMVPAERWRETRDLLQGAYRGDTAPWILR